MRVLAGNTPAGPRLAPPSTRFKTVVGMPATIALQYANGKEVQSRINNEWQMMYTLTSGEKAYFPLHVGEAIDSLTLAPGQPFTVCNRGGGNWDIDRAITPASDPPQALPNGPPFIPKPPPPSALPPQHSEPAPQPATKLEHALRTAILAAHNAEQYGADLGYTVRFDADAIKAMAITVLINMAKSEER